MQRPQARLRQHDDSTDEHYDSNDWKDLAHEPDSLETTKAMTIKSRAPTTMTTSARCNHCFGPDIGVLLSSLAR